MSAFVSKKILYIYDHVTSSAWYRCTVPGEMLNQVGHTYSLKCVVTRKDIESCDVLVVQRLNHEAALDIIQEVNESGRLTVFDIDDDYWRIHKSNPAYDGWIDSKKLTELATNIKECQLVTTTTKPLANILRNFNPNVRVIPNSLPAKLWPTETKNLVHNGPIIIGWAGSITHYNDLLEVSSIFPQLLEKYPQIEIHLAGADPSWFESHERLKFLDFVSIDKYANMLSGFDIGLAPLANIKFNESKSDLKSVEYGIIGIPTVASKVPSYIDTIIHGENGFIAKNCRDWLRYISILIEKPELRIQFGVEARKRSEKRTIETNIDKWLDAYQLGIGKPIVKGPFNFSSHKLHVL